MWALGCFCMAGDRDRILKVNELRVVSKKAMIKVIILEMYKHLGRVVTDFFYF